MIKQNTKIQSFIDSKGKRAFKEYLDFNKAQSYFLDHIDSGSCTLFNKIKKRIDFNEGSFFTFYNEDAFLERQYIFEGGIMPSFKTENPMVGYVDTLRYLSYDFMFNYLKSGSSNQAVLEQFIVEYAEGFRDNDDAEVSLYNEEVYYILNSETSIETIETAMVSIDHLWICFGVLTKDLRQPVGNLTEDDFDHICQNINYIFTTIYDGEGFLFWEKGRL